MESADDEQRVRDLLANFSRAVERAVPREMAALMCAEEAQDFLDAVAEPDAEGVASPDEAELEVLRVGVHGDVALARFRRGSPEVSTVFFRREDRRWTVCADAEDDLTLEQLDDDAWPDPPSDATDLVVRAHRLRRTPLGRLDVEGRRTLLSQEVGVDVLLSRVAVELQYDPLRAGDLFPGDLLVAALGLDGQHWAADPVSLTRVRIATRVLRELGDLNDHGAPHDRIWTRVSEFLARHPERA